VYATARGGLVTCIFLFYNTIVLNTIYKITKILPFFVLTCLIIHIRLINLSADSKKGQLTVTVLFRRRYFCYLWGVAKTIYNVLGFTCIIIAWKKEKVFTNMM